MFARPKRPCYSAKAQLNCTRLGGIEVTNLSITKAIQLLRKEIGDNALESIVIKGTINSGATTPALVLHAERDSVPAPLGVMTKVKVYPRTLASGDNDVSDIPRGGARILNVHFKTALTLSDITVAGTQLGITQEFIKSNFSVIEKLAEDYGRTFQSGYYHLEFGTDGNMSEALNTAGMQDLRFQPTASGAGACDFIVEYLDAFEGL